MSRHGPSAMGRFGVVTSFLGHDKWVGHWCHDLILWSRPGLLKVVSQPCFEVMTWFVMFDVATSFLMSQQRGLKWCRDTVLMSRHCWVKLVSRNGFGVATWLVVWAS